MTQGSKIAALIIGALLLDMFVAGNARALSPEALQKLRVYDGCLITQAAALDDHQSDAGTIADAALEACAIEFDNYVVEAHGATPTTDKEMLNFGGERRLNAIISVLTARRQHRSSTRSPDKTH